MKKLVDMEEAAKILGVTPRAIRKKFNKGKIEGEFKTNNRGGKSGQKLFVWIDDPLGPSIGTRKVARGEPGCKIETQFENGEPIIEASGVRREAQGVKNNQPPAGGLLPKSQTFKEVAVLPRPSGMLRGSVPADSQIAILLNPPSPPQPCETSPTSQGTLFPVVSQLGQQMTTTQDIFPRPIPASCQRTANLRFALIQAVKEKLSENSRPRTQIIKSFLEVYNAGISYPAIYNDIKSVSRATLYNWMRAEQDHGIEGLIPQYCAPVLSEILPGEKDFLLKFLLHQNKPKISDGIRECKRFLGEYSASSPTRLRRFVNDFKGQFHDVWTLEREGEKAWNDKDAPYQDRDPMLLSVGEVLVADGHKLNVNVIEPISGKKKRAVLVLFWDWKSTYPLGWEIMFSENTQCITTALRNALLTLGKIPNHIYIDNGKAFLAKIFRQKIVIEETEIPGMLARLGTSYRCALKYHGQSKPIERFFLVINDRLERRLGSYTGSSIADKPAYLLRNEPRAEALHDEWTPTTYELNEIMYQWREEYVDETLPKRQGFTARQMFEEGKGAGLDPKALYFLMMAVEIKTVRRNRFTFAGVDWQGECLYGYKEKVLIRYSLSDFSKIYVFDQRDKFMGIVTQSGKADPINDWQAAKQIMRERASFKRQTKRLADFIRKKPFVVDDRKNPELIEYIQTEEAKNKPEPNSPFIEDAVSTPRPSSAVPDEEQSRPYFDNDYDKYDWLMAQKEISQADQAWIDAFLKRSSLYKNQNEVER